MLVATQALFLSSVPAALVGVAWAAYKASLASSLRLRRRGGARARCCRFRFLCGVALAARAAAAMGIGCSFAVPCKAGGWPECRLCDSLCLPPAARVHSQAKKGLLSTALVVKAVELAKLFPQAPAGQPSPA